MCQARMPACPNKDGLACCMYPELFAKRTKRECKLNALRVKKPDGSVRYFEDSVWKCYKSCGFLLKIIIFSVISRVYSKMPDITRIGIFPAILFSKHCQMVIMKYPKLIERLLMKQLNGVNITVSMSFHVK